MQQAAKSIRVRSAGEDLRPRPGSAHTLFGVGLDHRPCADAKSACGMPASKPCGRRGRGETPCRSARPSGARTKERPASPEPERMRGHDARQCEPGWSEAQSGVLVTGSAPGLRCAPSGLRKTGCLTIEEGFRRGLPPSSSPGLPARRELEERRRDPATPATTLSWPPATASHPLDDDRRRHAAGGAHGDEAALQVAALQFVEHACRSGSSRWRRSGGRARSSRR